MRMRTPVLVSTTTQAATALQTQLALPPHTSCPCPTPINPLPGKFSIFAFLCPGPAPTTPAPPAHSARAPAPPAHPSAPLHAPFAHPSVHLHAPFAPPSMHLCAPFAHLPHTFCAPMCTLCSIFWVCHPYPTFFFNLRPPSGYHGQPSPSATGHSAHFPTSV